MLDAMKKDWCMVNAICMLATILSPSSWEVDKLDFLWECGSFHESPGWKGFGSSLSASLAFDVYFHNGTILLYQLIFLPLSTDR